MSLYYGALLSCSLSAPQRPQGSSATHLCSLELPPSLFRVLTHSARSTMVTDCSYHNRFKTICLAVAGSSLVKGSASVVACDLQHDSSHTHLKMDRQLAGASYSRPTMLGERRSRKA